MKKKLSVVVAALALTMAVTGCSKEETTENTNNDGKFIVGFDQNFPPMGFVGDDGEYTGFDLALAEEVAERMDEELVLQPIDWNAKDAELDAGNIDCIWNGFTISGREDAYTWTDPYMNNAQVIVVKEDSSFEKKDDLKGKTVEVQEDSSAQKAVEADTEFASAINLIKTADYNTALMELESGAVDAVVMDEIVANYRITNKKDKFRVLDDKMTAEEYGVGFKKGNEELRDKVQDTLLDMREDGTLEEISVEWFGEDITTIGK